jgi:hypothetical protein
MQIGYEAAGLQSSKSISVDLYLTSGTGVAVGNGAMVVAQSFFPLGQVSSSMNHDLQTPKAQPPSLFDRIFRDRDGNIVIGQMPNPPLLVAAAASLLRVFLPDGNLQTAVDLIAFGCWFTWAWQELFEGVNYFRRAIGLVVLVSIIALRLNRG